MVAILLVATIHQRLVRHLVRKAVVVDSAVRRPVQTTRTPDRVDPLLPDGAVDHQDLQDHTAVVLAMRVVPVATALVTVATTVQMPVVDLLVHQLAVVQVDPPDHQTTLQYIDLYSTYISLAVVQVDTDHGQQTTLQYIDI